MDTLASTGKENLELIHGGTVVQDCIFIVGSDVIKGDRRSLAGASAEEV